MLFLLKSKQYATSPQAPAWKKIIDEKKASDIIMCWGGPDIWEKDEVRCTLNLGFVSPTTHTTTISFLSSADLTLQILRLLPSGSLLWIIAWIMTHNQVACGWGVGYKAHSVVVLCWKLAIARQFVQVTSLNREM